MNAIVAAIQAPASMRCETFFATSNNRFGYRDTEHGKTLLGYEPLDSADSHKPN